MTCILPANIKNLQDAIEKEGGVKILRTMSSQERIDFLAQYVDSKFDLDKTNANILNRQIETKMLQPAQIEAVSEWLNNLPQDKRVNTFGRDNDIVEFVKNSEQILSPSDGSMFLESLVKQRLGFEATVEDTKELVNLANTASQNRYRLSEVIPGWEQMSIAEYDKQTSTGEGRKARDELGDSLLAFKEKLDEMKIKASQPATWKEIFGDKSKRNTKEYREKFMQIVYGAAGTLKAGKASFDISFLFRQLSGAWLSDPKSAAKGSWEGVKQFGKSLANPEGRRLAMRELMTRPNALNGNYDRFGLDIGIVEEAFEENMLSRGVTWASKKAGLGGRGNFFAASDDAMSIGLQWTRAEMFDSMYEQTGGDIQLLKAQDVGGAINQLTGRGSLPTDGSKFEKFLNMMVFSPRWVASRVQMLYNLKYIGQYFDKTPNGLRARAAVNNVLFMLSMASLVVAARAAWGDDEDIDEMLIKTFDPRSADFLNAKLGDLHIDLSFGLNNILRFAARFTTGSIMTGEGAIQNKSRGDILMRFLMSKQSPLAQNISYMFLLASEKDPKDFNYNPIGYRTFADAFLPISVSNIVTAVGDTKPETIGAAVADIVGISSQYWEPHPKNVGKSKAMIREQERLAFRTNAKVGSATANKNAAINTKLTGAKRERANQDFTRLYTQDADRLIASSRYKRMTDDQKKAALSKVRSDALKKINKKYGLK